jgi:hypothetical protein
VLSEGDEEIGEDEMELDVEDDGSEEDDEELDDDEGALEEDDGTELEDDGEEETEDSDDETAEEADVSEEESELFSPEESVREEGDAVSLVSAEDVAGFPQEPKRQAMRILKMVRLFFVFILLSLPKAFDFVSPFLKRQQKGLSSLRN